LPGSTSSPTGFARFCDELRPGDPPDGQRYLRQAFTRYYQSFLESDAKTRAELLLLANIEIGFHEQTRLQLEIAEALDALVVDPKQFRRRLIKAIFPTCSWLVRLHLFFRRLLDRPAPFDAATNMLIATARKYTCAIFTEHLMTIGLPGGERLGSDLSGEFPASLKKITNPDLYALLERADPQQPARNRCARLGLPTGSSASYIGYVSLLSRAAGSTRATIHSRAGRRTECWSFARRPIVSV
jgi:hypothetical protein